MQLRHDDALGTIDDEGAVVGHERQFAHVDFLLLDVLDLLGARRGLLVIDDQTHQHAQRCCVSCATQLTLALIEHRLAKAVVDILERRVARVADDRENRLERGVQAEVVALIWLLIGLQEPAVGLDLRCQQERHLQNAGALAKVFADAFLFGERIGHACLPSTRAI